MFILWNIFCGKGTKLNNQHRLFVQYFAFKVIEEQQNNLTKVYSIKAFVFLFTCNIIDEK